MYLADVSINNDGIELFPLSMEQPMWCPTTLNVPTTLWVLSFLLAGYSNQRGAPYIIEYSDFSVDFTGKKYWYRISAMDSCGARDTVTNISRNILLQVNNEKGLSNRLV